MKVNTALILCAGYGKRLNPLTLTEPKPLLRIDEITVLENCIKLIESLGIKKIIINTFYLREKIENFLSIKKFSLDVKIVDDGKNILNTGGGVLNMMNSSKDYDFLTLNPDTVWNENYSGDIKKMEKFYFSEKIKNILMVVNKDLSFDNDLNGDFNLINNKLAKNKENDFIYTGCQILNKNLFKKFEVSNFPISDIWNSLLKENKLYGYENKNNFYHLTNLKIYNELLKNQ